MRIGKLVVTTVAAQEDRDQEMWSVGYRAVELLRAGRQPAPVGLQDELLAQLVKGDDQASYVRWHRLPPDLEEALRSYV